jgi:hypothetical protein
MILSSKVFDGSQDAFEIVAKHSYRHVASAA